MEEDKKRVLGIQLPTDPRWVNMAEMSLEDILTDHAFCEQKATTSCISLIQRYSDKELLVQKVTPIVAEEWSHFRLVLKELEKRGLKLGRQRKDEYVNQLLLFVRKGVTPEDLLLDRLLVCAMIEARSCERFRLLSLNISDQSLRSFYHKFMVSEAGHYRLFLDLAEHYIGKEKTQERWNACLAFEAALVKQLKPRADRMH
ncbi:tRNA-(ms[2]io[6]A)-hydroxylase [Aureispira anguillae]|uniref:tRNA-(Ms[2]io[6]A)-hydroxylase n=1 Tax=Aureispira anguillae TaxID=2864201 RepID=A0A916DSJ9_9BACT|nr:tRNA-(ms[2]io[6]A)-hydroxylase [Aureispira anguillae]BDS12579.1 tRNA-(ms[2]io[6]A)-hydroxylase [Aureispira anguillae]